MSILLVDDNRNNLELLKKLLTGFHYEVLCANDGQEAINLLKKHRGIELIISDILMPNIDGFALCKRVKSTPEWAHIPFVFYSATYTTREDIEFAMSLGASKFLIKPMDPAKFINEISLLFKEGTHKIKTLSGNKKIDDEQEFLKKYNVRLIKKLEKKIAELEEYENRFSTILANSIQGFMIIQEGRILYVNNQFENILEFSLDEIQDLISGGFKKFIHPEDLQRIHKEIEGKNIYKEGYWGEFRIITASGKTKCVESRIAPVSIKNQPALQISIMDITERKENEKKLIESEEQLRKILTSMRDLVFIIDENKCFMDSPQNMSPEDLYRPRSQWVHKKYSEVLPEELSSILDEKFNLLKQGKENVLFEYDLEVNNVRRWFSANASVLKKTNGTFGGIVVVVRDITQMKEYEFSLERAKVEWEQTFNAIPDIVLVIDKYSKIKKCNTAVTSILGLEKSDLIGKTCYEMIFNRSEPCEICPIKGNNIQLPVTNEVVNEETGQLFEEKLSIIPSKYNGEDYVLFLRDITHVTQLQKQLLQSQKMEAIGQLAGGVAHDFNNILTVIEGYAGLALARLNKNDPLQKAIKQIISAGEKGKRLTSQLLAFSKRQILQPEILNMNQVIEDMAKFLRRLIGENIKLILKLQDDLYNVKMDYGQVEQIIINLSVNARDAMPEGGKLIIETKNYEVLPDKNFGESFIKAGNYVLVSISDTGIGMSKEIMEHIFEPFFTTKPEGKGTGLGLATVYGIVKQAGGQITVYSEPGNGTTFHIYLPAIEEKGKVEWRQKKEIDLDLNGTETILLVEDDDLVRDLAISILKFYGYTVLSARNPGEAFLILEKYSGDVDLVITDVIMPHMNGKEMVERIKKQFPNIKTLYMSGYSTDILFENQMDFQQINYIQKPFLPKDLAKKVREVLDSSK